MLNLLRFLLRPFARISWFVLTIAIGFLAIFFTTLGLLLARHPSDCAAFWAPFIISIDRLLEI